MFSDISYMWLKEPNKSTNTLFYPQRAALYIFVTWFFICGRKTNHIWFEKTKMACCFTRTDAVTNCPKFSVASSYISLWRCADLFGEARYTGICRWLFAEGLSKLSKTGSLKRRKGGQGITDRLLCSVT